MNSQPSGTHVNNTLLMTPPHTKRGAARKRTRLLRGSYIDTRHPGTVSCKLNGSEAPQSNDASPSTFDH